MSKLKLPDRYQKALLSILSLTEKDIDDLEAALSAIPVAVFDDSLSDQIAAQVSGISAQQARSLIDALLALYILKGTSTDKAIGSPATLVLDVARSIQFTQGVEALSREKEGPFHERLTRLLSIDRVGLCSKATGLRAEYERVFIGARIVSDIRPVYGDDPSASPTGALLIHNLKIDYIESGQRQSVFFALEPADVDNLLTIIHRAKDKESSMATLLSSCALNLIPTPL